MLNTEDISNAKIVYDNTSLILSELEPVHIKLLQFDNKYVIMNT